jgi:hypothetical protein
MTGTTTKASASVYWLAAQREVARMLSWQDREPFSQTYGCFDRTYWGWKLTDFPGARLQEGVYTLAHLYTNSSADNRLAGDPRALAWTRAGLQFWTRLQHADGSFDEAYPFEHSLAATAFTSFYAGEAYWRVREALGDDTAVKTLERAGDWLCRNDEQHGVLSNHLAAAAAALYVIYRITGNARFEKRCWHFVGRIYDRQSAEGWYEEYGGADPGYQTHATFYLARIWQYTHDATLLASLRRAAAFLKHFIHPNGTLGGEYGSRNTEFYFPAGFEMLAPALPDAALVARFLRPRIAACQTAGLWAMDVYNFFPLFNNYLCAAEHVSPLEHADATLPCQGVGEWYFPEAGLVVKSTSTWYAVIGLSKGGVLRIYDKANGQLAVSDCGYWARLVSGRVVSNQTLNRAPQWRHESDAWRIDSQFAPISQRLQSPWLFMAFRFFSITLGRSQTVAYWLKEQLVRVLVRPRRPVRLRLVRRVRFQSDAIAIDDEVTLGRGLRVIELRRGRKFSSIHMGSSRYFQYQELEPFSEESADYAAQLTATGRVLLTWTWRVPDTKD